MRCNQITRVVSGLALLMAGACTSVDAKLECTSNDDCFDGYACATVDTIKANDQGTHTVPVNVCLTSCTEATEAQNCLASQFCDVPTGSTNGVCRDSTSHPDGAGDPLPGGEPEATD